MAKVSSRMKYDHTGQRFGRWLVIGYAGMVNHAPSWNCVCDCGNTGVIPGGNLRLGRATSCGCYHSEELRARNTKHGNATRAKHTPEYMAWLNMRLRCWDKSNPEFHRYGGRGISVCERWANSFSNFLSDMGPRPSSGHSIDRKENNGNYEPDNCRWATRREQMANTSRSRFVVLRGERMIMSEAARRSGLSVGGIAYRIEKGTFDVHLAP